MTIGEVSIIVTASHVLYVMSQNWSQTILNIGLKEAQSRNPLDTWVKEKLFKYVQAYLMGQLVFYFSLPPIEPPKHYEGKY